MLHLQQLIDDPALLHEWRCTDRHVLMAAPDAQARETYRRTTFPFRRSGEKLGMNTDSWKPLEHQRRLFFVCGKSGCKHVVNAARAYRDAKRESRKKLKAGDGCPNGKCHNRKTWKWKRVAAYQCATITKIDTGSYILIRRPTSIGQKRITLVKSADVKKVTAAVASLE